MIIVDVEATGVDARLCSLLSIGAVEFEKPQNQFYEECRAFDGAHIEKEALRISGFGDTEIFDRNKQSDREAVRHFLSWLKTCSEGTLAGQNPSFDRDFLQETAHRYHINWPLAHRTIDLHSVAFFHMKRRGIEPPKKNRHSALNLDRILKYVNLPIRSEKHNALHDAKLEAEALSRLLCGKKLLLDDFSSHSIPSFLAAADSR